MTTVVAPSTAVVFWNWSHRPSASSISSRRSGAALARQAEHALASRGLANPREAEGAYDFLSTGDPELFRALGTRFLQLPMGEVTQVTLRTELAA